jgi:hypothetical protein
MSNRAISAVLDYSQTRGDDRVLMIVIADGISKDTEVYRARISTLMRQCNRSESAVHRHITRCIKAGELVVLDSTHAPNTFAVPILPGEPGYDPQPCDATDHTCNGYHTPLSVSREVTTDRRTHAVHPARAPRRGTPGGARSDTPRGARSDTPRGARSGTPGGARSDTPGGARSDTPGGARSDTPGGARSDTPGGARSDTPRAILGGGVPGVTPGGARSDTPGVPGVTPGGARSDTHYPYLTRSFTRDYPGAHTLDEFYRWARAQGRHWTTGQERARHMADWRRAMEVS